jgi:hypothetical protein
MKQSVMFACNLQECKYETERTKYRKLKRTFKRSNFWQKNGEKVFVYFCTLSFFPQSYPNAFIILPFTLSHLTCSLSLSLFLSLLQSRSLYLSFFLFVLFYVLSLYQRSQTRGPRSACGPPDTFVRPSRISKTDKIINFDQI